MGAMGTRDEAGAGLRGSRPRPRGSVRVLRLSAGLVGRCASCDSVLASWVGVGQHVLGVSPRASA